MRHFMLESETLNICKSDIYNIINTKQIYYWRDQIKMNTKLNLETKRTF